MSAFLNQRFKNLSAYVPGEQPKPGQYIKLNTNEFPYPPAESVFEASINAVKNMNLYSDLSCKALKDEFYKVFGYGENNVIFTNGSDDALYLCFLAFCGRDVGVAFADITYGFYSVYADLCCIDKKVIPLDDELSVVPEDYFGLNRTIFIANPNAPTGKRLSIDQIESVLKNNPENIVVIDEAYADFSGESCVSLLKKYDNLIVVGTFSKSRGMAGARLGYIITSEEICADIEKIRFSINPYNVNCMTQSVGCAVLKENSYYIDCVNRICKTRDSFSSELRALGFYVIPSKTNFVFAKHSMIGGKELTSALKEKGILIRHFSNERIDQYVRISIGTEEQMKIVIDAIAEIIGGLK